MPEVREERVVSAIDDVRRAVDRAMAAALRDDDHTFEPVEVDGLVLRHDGAGREDPDAVRVDAVPLPDHDGTEGGA
jgi:hypothetical protein